MKLTIIRIWFTLVVSVGVTVVSMILSGGIAYWLDYFLVKAATDIISSLSFGLSMVFGLYVITPALDNYHRYHKQKD